MAQAHFKAKTNLRGQVKGQIRYIDFEGEQSTELLSELASANKKWASMAKLVSAKKPLTQEELSKLEQSVSQESPNTILLFYSLQTTQKDWHIRPQVIPLTLSLLQLAAVNGHTEAFKMLLDALDKDGPISSELLIHHLGGRLSETLSAYAMAQRNGHSDIMAMIEMRMASCVEEKLISGTHDSNTYTSTLLEHAVYSGDVAAMQRMLKSQEWQALYEKEKNQYLALALLGNQPEMYGWLVEHGAIPQMPAHDFTPIITLHSISNPFGVYKDYNVIQTPPSASRDPNKYTRFAEDNVMPFQQLLFAHLKQVNTSPQERMLLLEAVLHSGFDVRYVPAALGKKQMTFMTLADYTFRDDALLKVNMRRFLSDEKCIYNDPNTTPYIESNIQGNLDTPLMGHLLHYVGQARDHVRRLEAGEPACEIITSPDDLIALFNIGEQHAALDTARWVGQENQALEIIDGMEEHWKNKGEIEAFVAVLRMHAKPQEPTWKVDAETAQATPASAAEKGIERN